MVCNTGVSLAPTLDGVNHHFYAAGLYDGLIVLKDEETGTYWNHVTGEGMAGPLAGRRLQVSNLLQMNVAQALAMDPLARIAISDQPYSTRVIRWTSMRATLTSLFEGTLGVEDGRRDRMELGLGIWSDSSRRFYPMATIRKAGALIDTFDGRTVVVYVDPSTSTPAAAFVDAGKAKREGDQILLDDGSVIRAGVRYDRTGEALVSERPFQLFTRWYGFSLTFPNPEVYEP